MISLLFPFFRRPRFLAKSLILIILGLLATAGQGQPVRPAFGEWTTYLNPRFGYQVPVPPGVRALGDARRGGSCQFASSDGALVMKVWGSGLGPASGDPLEESWREAVNLRGRRIDFQRRFRGGFVLAGAVEEGTEFFEKVILGEGATAGMTISYPTSLAARFGPWVEEMERGFTWHEGPPPLPAEPSQPRRGLFGDLREYFTGEEEDLRAERRRNAAPRESARTAPTPNKLAPAPTIRRDPEKTKVDLTPPPAPPKPSPNAVPPASSPAASSTASVPKPLTGKREDLPYGIAIPGKKGFVYSPFGDTKQQVDVSDIPTGTKVKCPYTSKVFRVP